MTNVPHWAHALLYTIFLLTFLASTVLSFLALLSIVTIEQPYKGTLWSICIVQVLGLVLAWARGGRLEKHFSNPIEVNKYLLTFIQGGSDIVIFSNTFAWLDDKIEHILRQKSSAGHSVVLYAPQLNEKLNRLQGTGIAVRVYKSLNLVPRVRFTLLDRNRAGSERLAVGQGDPSDFRVSQFRASHDPQVVAMASMIVEFVDTCITGARTTQNHND